MKLSVGTFNLNNLFSRYNFSASVDSARAQAPGQEDVSVAYTFDQSSNYVLREFRGRLVKGKDPGDTRTIAERILAMDVDVLGVQEVEDVSVLKEFNDEYLGGLYNDVVLIEGNDQRLIDVGVLSKLPVGAVTSFQTAAHPHDLTRRVFGRDLLGVEILDRSRRRKLFTLYNTHLKSHFVDFREDPVVGQQRNDLRRRRQAEMVGTLIGKQQRRGARYVLLGDMNDPVDSPVLTAMRTIDGDAMVNGLADPVETRPPKPENQGPGPRSPAWTYRRNPPGRGTPPEHYLFDQIWLSPGLGGALQSAHIDRRTKHGGDGGDHDPAWVNLSL